jgi:hypothetical protein
MSPFVWSFQVGIFRVGWEIKQEHKGKVIFEGWESFTIGRLHLMKKK